MKKIGILLGLISLVILQGCTKTEPLSLLDNEKVYTTCNSCTEYYGKISKYIGYLDQNEITKAKAVEVQTQFDQFIRDKHHMTDEEANNACRKATLAIPKWN